MYVCPHGSPNVTITHDALDLIVQEPQPSFPPQNQTWDCPSFGLGPLFKCLTWGHPAPHQYWHLVSTAAHTVGNQAVRILLGKLSCCTCFRYFTKTLLVTISGGEHFHRYDWSQIVFAIYQKKWLGSEMFTCWLASISSLLKLAWVTGIWEQVEETSRNLGQNSQSNH